jgi:hypothetical protein
MPTEKLPELVDGVNREVAERLSSQVESAFNRGWSTILYERVLNPDAVRNYMYRTEHKVVMFESVPDDFVSKQNFMDAYASGVRTAHDKFQRVNPIELILESTHKNKHQELLDKFNLPDGDLLAHSLFDVLYPRYKGLLGVVDSRFRYGALFLWNHIDGTQITERHRARFETHERAHVIGKWWDGYGVYTGHCFQESVDTSQLYGNVHGHPDYALIGVWGEVHARMSELLCYFGITTQGLFTVEHLNYAKAHFERDVGIGHPYMRNMLDSVQGERVEKFLWCINNLAA